jgi:Mrp family chromosome partitioning ATPase
LTDGFILVVEANATRREAALQVAENLRAANVRILGAVLNQRTFPIPEKLYSKL